MQEGSALMGHVQDRAPTDTAAIGYDAPQGTGESPMQRRDRAYAETLQEVRIAQCGIQILFATLLALGSTPAFTHLTGIQRGIYITTLLCTIGAVGTLMAPAAFHRFLYGRQAKRELLNAAHRHVIAGLAFLALAISGALLLILDMVLGTVPAVAVSAFALGWFALLWFLVPMHSRFRACRQGWREGIGEPGRQRPTRRCAAENAQF